MSKKKKTSCSPSPVLEYLIIVRIFTVDGDELLKEDHRYVCSDDIPSDDLLKSVYMTVCHELAENGYMVSGCDYQGQIELFCNVRDISVSTSVRLEKHDHAEEKKYYC